jgi:hypothetical protein
VRCDRRGAHAYVSRTGDEIDRLTTDHRRALYKPLDQ